MLAPPERHRKKLERRAADRRYQRDCRARRKAGLRRCQLWLSGRALEGIVTMLVATGKLSEAESANDVKLDAALAALLEAQGMSWVR